jgi:hypothetical protein
MTVSLLEQLKSLFHRSNEPLATRRLDGRNKELLAASIRMMPCEEERGWITIKEAAVLFSPADDEYAFRAMDGGKRNLASFVAKEPHRCRFAFIEGRSISSGPRATSLKCGPQLIRGLSSRTSGGPGLKLSAA